MPLVEKGVSGVGEGGSLVSDAYVRKHRPRVPVVGLSGRNVGMVVLLSAPSPLRPACIVCFPFKVDVDGGRSSDSDMYPLNRPQFVQNHCNPILHKR